MDDDGRSRPATGAQVPDAHLEPDPDQIVKVRHGVRPGRVPVQGPTDFAKHGRVADPGSSQVSVSPDPASYHEAAPREPPAAASDTGDGDAT